MLWFVQRTDLPTADRLRRRGLFIRAIYALCLGGAAVNHLRSIVVHGWFPPYLPWLTAAYWSSLTLLDPLAAVLLFVRPKTGIAITVAIIVSDVAHNLWFVGTYARGMPLLPQVATSPFLLSQIAFLIFVASTALIAWRDAEVRTNRQLA